MERSSIKKKGISVSLTPSKKIHVLEKANYLN